MELRLSFETDSYVEAFLFRRVAAVALFVSLLGAEVGFRKADLRLGGLLLRGVAAWCSVTAVGTGPLAQRDMPQVQKKARTPLPASFVSY